jgi:hypothetical protein
MVSGEDLNKLTEFHDEAIEQLTEYYKTLITIRVNLTPSGIAC